MKRKNIVKKTILLIGSSIMLLLPIRDVKAATKTYEFELNKKYSNATVTVTLPDDEYEYSMKLSSPDGKEYQAPEEEGKIEYFISDDVSDGEWQIEIDKYSTDEDGNKIESLEAIEGIDISFKGNVEKSADVEENVSVANDITGFTYYMIDNNLIVKWDDTTCGDVNVEIVNEDNGQTIGQERVQSMATSFEIPNDVSRIIIKVVPTVSMNVNGAEKQYSFDIPQRPDTQITIEELPVMEDGTPVSNKTELNYFVKAEDDCYVSVVRDAATIGNKEDVKKGSDNSYSVKIEEGLNELLFYITDKNGNMFSTPLNIYRDTVSPILQFNNDYNQTETAFESITFDGRVEDYDTFTCNGKEVDVEGDSTFSYKYELKEGINEIEFKAEDTAGNVSSYAVTVSRVIKEDNAWTIKLIIGVILALAIVAYVINVFRKKPQSHKSEETIDDEISDTHKKKKTEIRLNKAVIKEIVNLLIPVAVIIIIFKFIFCVGTVLSGSMEPTLKTGDAAVYNRLAYVGDREIKRGDIVAFYSEEYGGVFSKRVIGLPGDTVEFKDGYVVINGQYVDESDYIPDDAETNCSKTFSVPSGCYFLLGDNRENSLDSRFWVNPFISYDDIIGKYIASFPFSIERDILHTI